MIDEENPQNGIKELRPIDPLKIKKIRKVNKFKMEDAIAMPKLVTLKNFIFTPTQIKMQPFKLERVVFV